MVKGKKEYKQWNYLPLPEVKKLYTLPLREELMLFT
jgi:hypothetical protein